MPLKTLQKPLYDEELTLVDETVEEIKKDTQKARDEVVAIALALNKLYSGLDIPVKEQNELKKKITFTHVVLAASVINIVKRKSKININNMYYGNIHAYSSVAQYEINFNKLTNAEIEKSLMKKIDRKTYADRITGHSEKNAKKTIDIIRGNIEAGVDELAIKTNLTNQMGINFNQNATIGRTEVERNGSEMHENAYKAAEDDGFLYLKQWFHYYSKDERDDHVKMDGVKVGEGEFFVLPNGEVCPRPRVNLSAGQTINCRCQVEEVFVGSKNDYDKTGIPIYSKWLKGIGV